MTDFQIELVCGTVLGCCAIVAVVYIVMFWFITKK
jgi:hypothetical protein